ncbi:hypothetical protein B0H14DRAFT_3155454, partial [Mycena olivaceomarginata]
MVIFHARFNVAAPLETQQPYSPSQKNEATWANAFLRNPTETLIWNEREFGGSLKMKSSPSPASIASHQNPMDGVISHDVIFRNSVPPPSSLDRTDPEQIGQGLARDSPAAARMVKEILGGLQEDLYYDASALPCFLSFITWLQDNPPLRSGIPECKMKGAADFAVNMDVREYRRHYRIKELESPSVAVGDFEWELAGQCRWQEAWISASKSAQSPALKSK